MHTTHATFYVRAAVCVLVGCEICVGRLATCIALVTGLMIGVVLTLLVQVHLLSTLETTVMSEPTQDPSDHFASAPKNHVRTDANLVPLEGWMFVVPTDLMKTLTTTPPHEARRYARLKGHELCLGASGDTTLGVEERVNLTGCTVSIALGKASTPALRSTAASAASNTNNPTKMPSKWSKKYPLELLAPDGRVLARGESKLLLYLPSPPAKEAWYQHLSAASGSDPVVVDAMKEAEEFVHFAASAAAAATRLAPLDARMWDALLARLYFDMRRNEWFLTQSKNRLQEAVATACPPFLSALRVADLSLGAAPPTITSIRWANHTAPCGRAGEPAARMPNAACLEVAFTCEGDFWVCLETSIDLKNAAKHLTQAFCTKKDEVPANDVAQSVGVAPDLGNKQSTALRLFRLAGSVASTVADKVADKLSHVPLKLHVRATTLKGTLRIWIGAPPSNRIWYGFITHPELTMEAKPIVGDRAIRHTALAARVSHLLVSRLKEKFFKSFVLPGCSGFSLPMLCELHAHQTTLSSQSQPPPSLTARSQPNENANPISSANAFSLSASNIIQRAPSQSPVARSNTKRRTSTLGDVPTEDSPETSKLKKIDALGLGDALGDALGSNQSASSVNTVLPGVVLAVSTDVVAGPSETADSCQKDPELLTDSPSEVDTRTMPGSTSDAQANTASLQLECVAGSPDTNSPSMISKERSASIVDKSQNSSASHSVNGTPIWGSRDVSRSESRSSEACASDNHVKQQSEGSGQRTAAAITAVTSLAEEVKRRVREKSLFLEEQSRRARHILNTTSKSRWSKP